MRKVALIGTAVSSRKMAPYDDPEWEIWGCSMGNAGHISPEHMLRRVTIWFELHSIADMTGLENREWTFPYYNWLRTQQCKVFMQERNPYVPNAVPFPMPTLVEQFGKNWFTSSIAWMMAYAIHSKVDEIGIFGVDMAIDLELYSGQRDALTRWVEIAKERGIKISIPWESCLGMHRPLYGYDEATPFGRRFSVLKNLTEKQQAKMAADRDRLNIEIAFSEGALAQIKYTLRTWADGSNAPQHINIEEEAKAYVKESKK